MSKKLAGIFLFFVLSVFFMASPIYATTFDLIPPAGTLERGQNVTFTINIDTEGVAVTTIQSGLTFDSTLLQYVSTTPGAAMNSVVADTTTYGAGKVLLTGTNNAGYNGTGVFATVVFTIIAQNPGSTEVCTLWLPTPTGTPAPTPTAGPVCGSVCTSNTQCPSDMPCYILAGQTSGYCRRAACPEINSCVCPAAPVPTALPQTGITDSRNTGIALGATFLLAAGGIFYLSLKQKYSFPDSQPKKHSIKSRAHKKA